MSTGITCRARMACWIAVVCAGLGALGVSAQSRVSRDRRAADQRKPAGRSISSRTAPRPLIWARHPRPETISAPSPSQNLGTATLNSIAITTSGTNVADFTISSLGSTSIAPGGTTTFLITFVPSAIGTRTAAIQIASNDPVSNPFNLNLTGFRLCVNRPQCASPFSKKC